ncbi:Pvc16 family protein [Roseateles cellulosilyticus]|uniref:DUF4255 domain-containing protein n=1 Tax=Pelomonas cellulosilytica TaxID=2906762 RepID=A0ABS8XR56_9BURK|nr:DUF4255 domain-containing protein [Pelomonas sp. P8]
MIDAALLHLAGHLNAVLRRSHQSAEDLVAVTGLQEADGSPAAAATHRLSAFLVNLEPERVPGQPFHPIGSGERLARSATPLHLNLLVMFAANYGGTTYPEALKLIGSTIACFQATPVLDAQNSPGLDARLDKLMLSLEPLGLQETATLWGMLGGRYVPSVLYRVRLLTIDARQPDAQLPAVRSPRVGVAG